MQTPSRHWAPAKGKGPKNQSFAALASEDEAMQRAAEASDAERTKRVLTPVKTPDQAGKRHHPDTHEQATEVNTKMEMMEKLELQAEFDAMRAQLDSMTTRMNTQENQALFYSGCKQTATDSALRARFW